MTLKLYNTLTRKNEAIVPSDGKTVKMYSCGPTVYDSPHIGNLRAFAAADLLRRYLKYRGFKVKQLMNLTDVDDKTIRNSREQGIALDKYTERFKKAFFQDIDALNISRADVYPEATKHIPQMVKLVESLLKKGYAYKGSDGSIYFDIRKFPDYGKLSHTKLSGLKAGARVSQDEYDKAQASDFVLWKAWSEADGDVFWDGPLGKGRPGWHIECSAMSMHYLGPTVDIHTGGVDLVFPHHENEIAQSQAMTGKPFVNHWFHNEHLLVEGRKMSKCLGNFYSLADIDADPLAVRLVLISTHYRQKLDFSKNKAKEAETIIKGLRETVRNLKAVSGKGQKSMAFAEEAEKQFIKALDDDLNISEALAALFEMQKQANLFIKDFSKDQADIILKIMEGFDSVLGLKLLDIEEWLTPEKAPKEVMDLILQRESFRKTKDWKKADEAREKLTSMGVVIEDTPQGPRWRR